MSRKNNLNQFDDDENLKKRRQPFGSEYETLDNFNRQNTIKDIATPEGKKDSNSNTILIKERGITKDITSTNNSSTDFTKSEWTRQDEKVEDDMNTHAIFNTQTKVITENEEEKNKLNEEIKNINIKLNSLKQKCIKENNALDSIIYYREISNLDKQKKECLKKFSELEKCKISQQSEDISFVANVSVNEKENKNKILFNTNKDILNTSSNNNEKVLLSKKRFQSKDEVKNSELKKFEKEEEKEKSKKEKSHKPLGRISNELKEKGVTGKHDKNILDNATNKSIIKYIHSMISSIILKFKEFDENFDEKIIPKIGLNKEDKKNNKAIEEFLKSSNKEIICKFIPKRSSISFKERFELNCERIDKALSKDIPGKEEIKKEIKLLIESPSTIGFAAFLDNFHMVKCKDKNGKEYEINLPNFKTFNDYFNESEGYNQDIQSAIIEKVKSYINGTSKKRKIKRNKEWNLKREEKINFK